MNKKGQTGPMGMEHMEGNRANPLIYLGIFIFVLPFLSGIVHIKFPNWLTIVGVIFILIGAGLSIYSASR
jgi:drug/metabolite transporter (DMT)-like permease